MAAQPEFDVQAAHRYFSAACFNQAWELIEKPDRTPAEDEEMIRLNLASMWHWTQRADVTARNLSVGYWQASRIYALLGQADNARRYGQLSLDAGQGEAPFFVAYAYEALARAEAVAGNRAEAERYLAEAHRLAEAVAEADEHKLLLDDLGTI